MLRANPPIWDGGGAKFGKIRLRPQRKCAHKAAGIKHMFGTTANSEAGQHTELEVDKVELIAARKTLCY